MDWTHHLFGHKISARRTTLVALSVCCLLLISLSAFHAGKGRDGLGLQHGTSDAKSLFPLPEESDPKPNDVGAQGFCAERFGNDYLWKFSKSFTEYCAGNSSATLTCFTHKAHDQRTDSFCVGSPAIFALETRKFDLDCYLREASQEGRNTVSHPLSGFPFYWYHTGPHTIFNGHINLGGQVGFSPADPKRRDRVYFLVQREEIVSNLWHTLMQVMSLVLSLDVLRITTNPTTGEVFLTDQDVQNSQVVILDPYDDGPFFELWTMIAGLPPTRLREIDEPTAGKVVVPLPGGSNPIWQGDWIDLPCDESALLNDFVTRILNHYSIALRPMEHTPITLTFIDRREKRHLLDQEAYFSKLRSKYPEIDMRLVDFAAISFPEQLRVIRTTDILVGVHGAGLTHAMFLPPGSSVAEILPPTLDYRGFKNIAKLRKCHYFGQHGEKHSSPGQAGDWQIDDVFIEEEQFMQLMEMTITSAKLERSRADSVRS